MKLYLDRNIIEGTPEELVEYQRLVEDKDKDDNDGLLGYNFWYLEGTNFNKFVVLEARTNYFEDSRGNRYTYQAVSEHVRPVDREDVLVKFESAKDNGKLLMYYSTVDLFTHK